MTIIKYIKFVVIIVIVTIIFSCSKNEAGNSEYDPSLPISLTDFSQYKGEWRLEWLLRELILEQISHKSM